MIEPERLVTARQFQIPFGTYRKAVDRAAPRVRIVDDEDDLRDALANLLNSAGYEVDLFGSPEHYLAASFPETPCCLVLDIRLKAQSGLDFQRHLRDAGRCTPIILMTGHADVQMAVQGMKQGAVDFLTKPLREEDLLSAVAAAVQLDRNRRHEAEAVSELHDRLATLSQRELQVMGLIAAGLLNKQVAGQLHLSEATVKIHRSKAMRKMAASSLADLVRMAELLGVRDESVTRLAQRPNT